MQNNTLDDVVEIDLQEIFFELLTHWKAILLSTILTGVIVFMVSFYLITPMYESTSELYVLSKSTSITSLTDLQMGTNLTNDYMVVVGGRPILEQVIENLGLEDDYDSLSDRLTLTNPTNSRILQITVKDTDPDTAKMIADNIADVASDFIAQKMDQDPPSIITRGYADGKKVSPHVARNSAVGALLGAMAAMGLVSIMYLLNDTILGADDVEGKLGMTLLGTLPLEESEQEDSKKTNKKVKKTKGTKKK